MDVNASKEGHSARQIRSRTKTLMTPSSLPMCFIPLRINWFCFSLSLLLGLLTPQAIRSMLSPMIMSHVSHAKKVLVRLLIVTNTYPVYLREVLGLTVSST